VNVSDLVVRSAESLVPTQRQDGSFAPGHNGPYYDEELPLRNTGHALVLMLRAHELSREDKYQKSALRALEYMTAEERRPMGATFWVRNNPEKDFSNGLIGQAWVIEALDYAARKLGDDRLIRQAEEVFLLHPFDEEKGRWRVVNVDGSYDPVDMTFNHQLWFAAAGSFLQGNELIRQQVRRFMDTLGSNLEMYSSGLIVHPLGGLNRRRQPIKRRLKQSIKTLLLERGKAAYADVVINKAIGYHAFNTHGFSLLYNHMKDHVFWGSETCSRILNFLLTDLYREGLDYYIADSESKGKVLPFNRFGYPYNPPGIEVAFTMQTFAAHYGAGYEKHAATWLGRQFDRTFDPESGLMNRQTDDEVTLAVRMYEAVRLKEYEFQVNPKI